MSDIKQEKRCSVCGDKAAGYNFNVLSCVSCKAFFRRNALKNKELKCPFSDKCEITSVTRKFCQKCRLTKCFAVGMKKELILSEEDKQRRRHRVSQKKKNGEKEDNDSTSDDLMTDSSSKSPVIDDQFISDILNDDSISEEDVQAQISEIESSFGASNDSNEISIDVLQKTAEFEMAIIPITRPMDDYRTNFTEMEGNRLSELFAAIKIMDCPLGEYVYKVDNSYESLCMVCENSEMIIERLVQASKQLTLFNEVCENDQLALIKYGAIEISCMRQAIGYDKMKNQLKVAGDRPNTTVVMDLNLLKDSPSHVQILYAPTKKYYDKFSTEWECDDVILSLLTVIVLFNPDRPKLMHRDMIKYQQFIYMYLLKRYLQLRYQSECIAKTKFLRLLNTFKPLSDLYAKHLEMYTEAIKLEPNSCEDSILNEVYNPD